MENVPENTNPCPKCFKMSKDGHYVLKGREKRQYAGLCDVCNMVTCGRCGNYWDGMAQCDCWEYTSDYYDDDDDEVEL